VTRPLFVLFLTIFISLVGFGIIIPLLPFYAETFGASPTQIGLLFASFSISQLIAAPMLGDWSDRWGRRPVLFFSLVGTVISFVLLALAHSLTLLFVARIIDGLSGGNITTARAYIADISSPEERAKRYGLIGAAFGLGFICGPALGALLAHISITAPIWAAAGLSAVAAALAWFWLPEPVRHQGTAADPWWRVLPGYFERPRLRRLLFVDLFYWSSFGVYQTTFALFGQRRFGWDATHIGYVLTAFGLLGVIVQVGFVGPLTKALGDSRTLLIGLGLAACGFLVAAMTREVPIFLLTLLPAAMGIGLCNPTLSSLVSKSVPQSEQGLVQGAAGALESLGRTVAPIAGGLMLQHYGEGTAYVGAALLLFVTAGIALPLLSAPQPQDAMPSA
jgi:DHA1 family tetracycline resistance protein-like MFS transporter